MADEPKSRSEVRDLSIARAELRVEQASDGKPKLVGYAAVFDSWSEDLGGFVERVRPGCFARCLAERPDVRYLVNHNRDLILGRTLAGTLKLTEDSRGLLCELDPPDTETARHYVESVRLGNITGMSFRFYVVKDAWDFAAEPCRRDLVDVDIDDVCLATYPAYTDSTAAVRSLENHRRDLPRHTPRRDRAARLLRLAEAD